MADVPALSVEREFVPRSTEINSGPLGSTVEIRTEDHIVMRITEQPVAEWRGEEEDVRAAPAPRRSCW